MNLERYQRHSLVDWFDQEKLLATSVLVIGAGAIGNEVLKNLCLLGVGHLRIIDFDKIEEHNLTRTVLFKPTDIGRFKAEAAAAACQQLDPNVKVTFSNEDFWGALSLAELKRYDAVFCCVDNFEARFRLNQMCLLAHVNLLNAGIDSRYIDVQIYPFREPTACACYECSLPPSVYATVQKRYSCGWLKKVALDTKKIPTTAITSSMAGAAMVSLFLQNRCEHSDRPRGAQKYTLDTVTLNSSVASISQSDLCPACSHYQPDAHHFTAQRSAIPGQLGSLVELGEFTVFLSDRLVLAGHCKECGQTVDIFDLASKFDERLAECGNCRRRSNNVTIVDSLPCHELLHIFQDRALPVKFFHFKHQDQQFIIELEN